MSAMKSWPAKPQNPVTRCRSVIGTARRLAFGWSPGGFPLGLLIRKLAAGEYRLYSRKKDPKTGKRKNLGTFKSRASAEKHERAVQFFKRRG